MATMLQAGCRLMFGGSVGWLGKKSGGTTMGFIVMFFALSFSPNFKTGVAWNRPQFFVGDLPVPNHKRSFGDRHK